MDRENLGPAVRRYCIHIEVQGKDRIHFYMRSPTIQQSQPTRQGTNPSATITTHCIG